MVEVPSFFNKIDFFGRLLPGYVAVTLYLLLFKPQVLSSSQQTILSTHIISFDLFSAIVFLVAGPAVGFTLTWLGRSLTYMYSSILGFRNKIKRERGRNYVYKYSKLRVSLKDTDPALLDQAEAELDFCVSAGIALLFVDIYYSIFFMRIRPFQLIILIFSLVLFAGARYQWSQTYGPLLYSLFAKYNIE